MELAIQFDLFKTEEESEKEALRKEVKRLQKSLDKVRRGTYARLNSLEKQQIEILEEFESWKRTVCQQNNTWQDFQNLPGKVNDLFDGLAVGM